MDEREEIEQLAHFLVLTGHYPPEVAQRMAARMVTSLRSVSPGAGYGHLWPEDLPRIWAAAERHGRCRLLLEVCAEGQDQDELGGHVSVRVALASDWPGWDEGRRVRYAFADALAMQQGATDPLTLAHRRSTSVLSARAEDATAVPELPAPPETALQKAHRLVSGAMTRATDPDQRDRLSQARKLLRPSPAPDGELMPRGLQDDDRQEEAFEVPASWTETVLELMLEGPMPALEHEAREAAAHVPRILN